MFAFLDSPIGLIVFFVVVLILFGPQKLPEIGQQLGRAIRELRRTTQDFTSAINADDRYEPTYDPPRYDSYESSHDSATTEESWQSSTPETASAASEPARGDFAAAAMADTAEDYGMAPPTAETIYKSAPSSGNGASTPGALSPPEHAVSRTETNPRGGAS